MSERIPTEFPWSDLAGRALGHTIARRDETAIRCVYRLADKHGFEVLPQVLLAWIDTAIGVVFPGGPPDVDWNLSFLHEDTEQMTGVDQTPPGIVWAGRFFVARLADDEAQGRALLNTFRDSSVEEAWGEAVLGVLNVCGSMIRRHQAGVV